MSQVEIFYSAITPKLVLVPLKTQLILIEVLFIVRNLMNITHSFAPRVGAIFIIKEICVIHVFKVTQKVERTVYLVQATLFIMLF